MEKVYLEPGHSVTEVDPEEDGMVNVRTSNGNEGSIPASAIGGKHVRYLVFCSDRRI